MRANQYSETFRLAVVRALAAREWTVREAGLHTRISRTTIGDMAKMGAVPGRGTIIQWAEGLGEDINAWLALAGYNGIRPDLVGVPVAPPVDVEALTNGLERAKSIVQEAEAAIEEVKDQCMSSQKSPGDRSATSNRDERGAGPE